MTEAHQNPAEEEGYWVEACHVCGIETGLCCTYHPSAGRPDAGGLCANCECPLCKAGVAAEDGTEDEETP